MRIMPDTNILVSAILLDSKAMNELFKTIFKQHTLVLSGYTIKELFEVAEEKFPDKTGVINRLLNRMPYEYINTPDEITPGLFDIRDPDDYPILYTAIKANIDILITRDKDLLSVKIERPEIIKPHQFLERFYT